MIDPSEYKIYSLFYTQFLRRDLGVGAGLETRVKTVARHVTRAREKRAKGKKLDHMTAEKNLRLSTPTLETHSYTVTVCLIFYF